MIETYTFEGSDFHVLMHYEGWQIGFLRYSERFSKVGEMERHTETDEAFILLEGTATLYTEKKSYAMQKLKLYNVPKNTWHHIVVEKNTTVLIAENSNTSPENTEKAVME